MVIIFKNRTFDLIAKMIYLIRSFFIFLLIPNLHYKKEGERERDQWKCDVVTSIGVAKLDTCPSPIESQKKEKRKKERKKEGKRGLWERGGAIKEDRPTLSDPPNRWSGLAKYEHCSIR